MALAAATHHSAQRGECRVPYDALRGQKTASAAGMRPAPLEEEAEPLAARAYRAAGLLSPALAVLGGGGDVVDAAALAFLLAQNLSSQAQQVEDGREEEERQRRELAEVEMEELRAEQYALLQLGSRRSPCQDARLRTVTR